MSKNLKSRLYDIMDSGHFLVITPDGVEEDYDVAIPDYFINLNRGGGWVCYDANGSEPIRESLQENPDGSVSFILEVDDREYHKDEEETHIELMTLLVTVSGINDDGALLITDVTQ